MLRAVTSVMAVLTLSTGLAFASELQDDLKARRARVMEKLGPDAMLILWSAPAKVFSNDVDYEFRQDSNLYYLTGIDQPDTILVLMPGNQEQREILFVKPRNPVREHWDGHILSKDEATDGSGVATVHLTTEFEAFLNALLSRRPFGGTDSREFEEFFRALDDGRARIHLLLPRGGDPDNPAVQLSEKLKNSMFSFALRDDVGPILRDLRQIKTAYEQQVLQESADLSSEAHMAGMRAAKPGAYEYEVEAAIEYVYKAKGGSDWSYPSIVGSGPNATVLHYNASKRKMQAGDLLLVDAAANYKYMTVDITRTYPVSGAFSQVQKDIYSIVLQAQEEAMKVVKPGARASEVHAKTIEVIKDGLLRLGLITEKNSDQFRTWYTHGSVHWIGIDVHDTGDQGRALAPGMAFVIEPGIYVREGALDNLPRTPENQAFIEKVRPAYEKYKSIGIRIEDSFLLTESGLKWLSAKVPRTIEEIESFLKPR